MLFGKHDSRAEENGDETEEKEHKRKKLMRKERGKLRLGGQVGTGDGIK